MSPPRAKDVAQDSGACVTLPKSAAPIATAKIIAGNWVSDGKHLRAVVTVVPAYDTAHLDALKNWPGEMLRWLDSNQWQFRLKAQVATRRSGTAFCLTDPQGVSPGTGGDSTPACAAAYARGARETWGGRSKYDWLNQLWQAAITGLWARDKVTATADQIADSFKALADTLRVSTLGLALQAGEGLAKEATDKKAAISVETLCPARQSDLTVLFEIKRALELCDTVNAAHGFHQAYLHMEELCSAAPAGTQCEEPRAADDLGAYLEEAQAHYHATACRVKALYEDTKTPLAACSTGKVLDPPKPPAPQEKPALVAGMSRDQIEQSIESPLNTYRAATQRPVNPTSGSCFREAEAKRLKDVVAQRFFALQGSPALSRLLGLTFDVLIEPKELDAHLGPVDARQEIVGEDNTRFIYLGLDTSIVCEEGVACRVSTLTKYRAGSNRHFFPVCCLELQAAAGVFVDEKAYELSQFEGVIAAGQEVPSKGGGPVRRFELTSLDVRAAAEAAIDKQMRKQAEVPTDAPLTASLVNRPTAIARKTHQTVGLTLLDRSRQQQAVGQLASRDRLCARLSASNSYIVLDAEDLLIGYRLDVGVPQQKTKEYGWRSLMARMIKHGITGMHTSQVQRAIDSLYGNASDARGDSREWQQRLEDGVIALPSRLIPRETDHTQIDAYVEEALTTWAGESLAVVCCGTRQEKLEEGCDLPVGQVMSLQSDTLEPERRAPPLRLGCAYRMGVRAVYPGGLSISLGDSAKLYDDPSVAAPGTCLKPLSVPPAEQPAVEPSDVGMPKLLPDNRSVSEATGRRRGEMRRFLRHERVDAPLLLLPESVALHRNGPMGFERAAHAIVRTATTASARFRGTPIETQRVFVVPCVDPDFAALHGVFDRVHAKCPPDGLRAPFFGSGDVRFDADDGGFPVVASKSLTGINGAEYDAVRSIETDTKVYQGDLVYAIGSSKHERCVRYYPDPAVQLYAIGVRYANTDTYLPGGPFTVKVYDRARGYPNARPLTLTVTRRPPRKKGAALHPPLSEVVMCRNGLQVGDRLSKVPGSIDVVMRLAPGEDFEVDVWCLPDAPGLAARFAVVEAIGAIALARRVDPEASSGSLLKGLASLLPGAVCDATHQCLANPTSTVPEWNWLQGYSGPGSLPTPGPRALSAIARALHETASRRPLDEIAAVRTFRVTHAVDHPHAAPEFDVPKPPRKKVPEPWSVVDTVSLVRDATGGGYSLSGRVLLHLPTVGALEIRARTPSPHSDKLDDTSRGRSLKDIKEGTWPLIAQSPGISKAPALQSPCDVFGFNVSPEGEVTFPAAEIVLQRIDRIPTTVPASCLNSDGVIEQEDGVVSIPLKMLTQANNPLGVRFTQPFQFPGQIARELELYLVAYPRNAELMREANSRGVNGVWLRNGRPLNEADSACAGEPVCGIQLEARARPATPSTRSPIPVFVWPKSPVPKHSKHNITTLTRFSLVRVFLTRPSVSSGQGERLGVVLWPPNLFDQDPAAFAQDRVALSSGRSSGGQCPAAGRVIQLDKFFLDEDLGAGGKFVTRWGGDPIRVAPAIIPTADAEAADGNIGGAHTLIPASAFLDLSPDTRMGFEAQPVACVEMPIKSERTPGSKLKDPPPPETLAVSLVTYEPRFDLESEQWYVDMAIQHPFEAEPFLRLGLVLYQPNAAEDLKVSYPTTQWTQLLPKRDVCVESSRKGKARAVKVAVTGLSQFDSPELYAPSSGKPEYGEDYRDTPPVAKLVARLVREHHIMKGVIGRRVIEELSRDPSASDLTQWSCEFEWMVNEQQDAAESAKYHVIVEEREARLPATYKDEPVGPKVAAGRQGGGGGLIDAGPRFVARVPV